MMSCKDRINKEISPVVNIENNNIDNEIIINSKHLDFYSKQLDKHQVAKLKIVSWDSFEVYLPLIRPYFSKIEHLQITLLDKEINSNPVFFKIHTFPWSEFEKLNLLRLYGFFPSIPLGIKSAMNIDTLICEGNGLNSIPNEICDMNNLVFLNLNGNNLSKIPDCIFNLKSLRYIDVSLNKIKEIQIERIKEDTTKFFVLSNNLITNSVKYSLSNYINVFIQE